MSQEHSRPLIPVNPQGLDEIAKALLEGAPAGDEIPPNGGADIPEKDRENYMILEGREHKSGAKKYDYRDLFVGLHRLGMSSKIETMKSQLGFEVDNTAQEQDGTKYIGNINWNEALKLNLALGGRTLHLRQGIDFLIDLRDGIEGKKELHYASGKKIPKNVLQRVYNEIIEVRNPYRAEWLDADFKVVNGVLHMNYGHELGNNGVLTPRFSEPLESFLDDNGVMVNLQDFNRQGLPTRKQNNGDIYYWKPLPDNNSVAGFYAVSDRAVLGCNGGPAVRYSGLGVRFVREKK